MKRAVLVICDGHRADLVRPELSPVLCGLADGGRRFANHSSIFPSVTRSVSASIATGCRPARHGLHGNTMALDFGDGPVVHDVGKPEFRDAMRHATGRTLHVPTMVERVSAHGAGVVYSNVSPGAAYFQDPEGFGHVYHRAGSYAPGLRPLNGSDHLDASPDAAGDAMMTDRFCNEALRQGGPSLAVLWLGDPDRTMHKSGLGSPEHRQALIDTDANLAKVADAVSTLRARGDEVLLMIGSDHGQETIGEVVHLDQLLVDAGLKADPDSTDVAVAAQGFGCLIYLRDPGISDRIVGFLREQQWLGAIHAGPGLAEIGLPNGQLAIAISTAEDDVPNQHGVRGIRPLIAPAGAAADKRGLGSHGGLGRYEQAPFLIADGGGAAAGTTTDDPTSVIDIAPTILRHLGLPFDEMDGRPLRFD